MKQIVNQFSKGLITDLHPLMTNNTQLTDALNATFITYNGNEMMLQNDMGNAIIQDAETGNIMGLSDGFIPVGVKEHGGIIYIVSANKDGVGEIGTIPSPILTVDLKSESFNSQIINLCSSDGPKTIESIVSNKKIFPGEKFVVMLKLTHNGEQISSKHDIQLPGSDIFRPFISQVNQKGLYRLDLYSVTSNSTISLSNVCQEEQWYYDSNNQLVLDNDYWFILNKFIDDINIDKTYKNKLLKTYPGNLPSGRLAVKAELEPISSFGFIRSLQPLAKDKDKKTIAPEIKLVNNTYHLCFPGFVYTTDSARYVKNVKMIIQNQVTGEEYYNNEFVFTGFPSNGGTVYQDGEFLLRSTMATRPLVDIEINKLNQWIKVKALYYDQYDGYIDTLSYSFNPYHIINYQEIWYNPQLIATRTTQQYYNVSASGDVSLDTLHFSIPSNSKLLSSNHRSFSWGNTGDITDSECAVLRHEQGYYQTKYYPVITEVSGELFTPNQSVSASELTIPALNLKYLAKPISQVRYSFNSPGITVTFSDTGVISYDVDTQDEPIISVSLSDEVSSYSNTCQYVNPTTPSYGWTLTYNGESVCFVDKYTQQENVGIFTQQSSEQEAKFLYNRSFAINGTHGLRFVGSPVDDQKDAIEVGWDGGKRNITVSADSNPQLSESFSYVSGQSFPNKSIYSVHEGFKIYAEDEEGEEFNIGFNKFGEPKKAWTFGNNLINESIPKLNTKPISSLYANKEYLASSSEITKVLSHGVYLLSFNYGSGTNSCSATIKVSNISRSITNFNGIIEPILIYIPEKSSVSISWVGLNQLHAIGLYSITKPIKYSGNYINSGSEPIVVSYHDESISTDIILPTQLTYVENNVKCYTQTYNYYCGTIYPYYLDQIVYTNEQGKKVSTKLRYEYDGTDDGLLETNINFDLLSTGLSLNGLIKYRVNNELS